MSTIRVIFKIVLGLFIVLCGSALTMAQEAKITALKGEVFVSSPGEPQLPAVVGTVLPEGDSIRTYTGAKTSITLPDGSKVQLGEDTNLVMTVLARDAKTNVSNPRLELLWGNVRTILSPLHRKPGSSFTLHTPNTLMHSSDSPLDVEIQYEPATKTTIVLAHEFDVRVTSRFSGTSRVIPQGHSGVIYQGIIQEIARIIEVSAATQANQQIATISSFDGEVFVSIQGQMWTPVFKGTVLQPGDALETSAKARAVLQFADGTTVALDENTTLNIALLIKNPQTEVWTARLELLRGSLRTILAKGFRKAESSCVVQTSNVRVSIAPAREMDTAIIYNPDRSITTVMAHKSTLTLLHRLTEVSATLPPGHSGIVHNNAIQQVGRILHPLKKDEPKKQKKPKK